MKESLLSLYRNHKEKSLFGRYVHNESISEWLKKIDKKIGIEKLGASVENRDIISLNLGDGSIKVLAWSQMHGNESTTTKAISDLINVLQGSSEFAKHILGNCTIKIIPILNPDGAFKYTRENANKIDLNRDAQSLSQPESKLLRAVFDGFKPDYCFNLHGQRTIFGVGNTGKPAKISFLSPAKDANRSITNTRKRAMAIIVKMNEVLQSEIPGQIGKYDDNFNMNCVGDTFQLLKTPTILFEAGHSGSDYNREDTRYYIFLAIATALNHIADSSTKPYPEHLNKTVEAYSQIPENEKNFFDILLKQTKQGDIGIQYREILKGDDIVFVPEVSKIGELNNYFGHLEIDAKNSDILNSFIEPIKIGDEIVFEMKNNEKFALKPKNI
ncbi:MAG: M14 metallopeptidase family protein [Bacteroidota bacterium]